MEFKDKLKQARESFGLSQNDLAQRANISRVSVGNYERGTRKPNSEILMRLAKALHTTPDYLLGKDPYFNSDDKASKIYYKYLQNEDQDFFFEEVLERYGYIIEPSIFEYNTMDEKKQKTEEWMCPEKQYYNIIHNGTKIRIKPQELFDFIDNIKKAMEFEWFKLTAKHLSDPPADK